MQTLLSDFIALYNAFWYRDFPVSLGGIDFAKRADWTTHIATSVRQVASLMGLFSCFESGGRTDAELQFSNRKVWAKLEWEWDEAREHRVGELDKLASASNDCEVCIFIGYSQIKHHEANLPVISICIGISRSSKWQHFDGIEIRVMIESGLSFSVLAL